MKRRLRARLEELGYRPRAERRIEVLAGGARLAPQLASGGLYQFMIRPGVQEVRIVSACGMPTAVFAESGDTRRLGAQLALVMLGGEWIRIDSPMLADGFHPAEHDASGSWRWTSGDARLRFPPSDTSRLLTLFVRDVMRSWIAPELHPNLLATA